MSVEAALPFVFLIAVREAELWNRSEICEGLKRLLAFLSDEEYRFEFVPAESPVSGQM